MPERGIVMQEAAYTGLFAISAMSELTKPQSTQMMKQLGTQKIFRQNSLQERNLIYSWSRRSKRTHRPARADRQVSTCQPGRCHPCFQATSESHGKAILFCGSESLAWQHLKTAFCLMHVPRNAILGLRLKMWLAPSLQPKCSFQRFQLDLLTCFRHDVLRACEIDWHNRTASTCACKGHAPEVQAD